LAVLGSDPGSTSTSDAATMAQLRPLLQAAFGEMGYPAGTRYSATPGSSGSLSFEEWATWLWRSSREGAPEGSLHALESLLHDNQVPMLRVAAMWGLNIDSTIELGSGLSLRRLVDVPSSGARDSFVGAKASTFPALRTPQLATALVHQFNHSPLFVAPGSSPKPFTWDDKHLLSDIIVVLTFVAERPLIRVAEWYQVDRQVPVLGHGFGWGASYGDNRITYEVEPTPLAHEAATSLIQGFLTLSQPSRLRLLVTARRLNLSYLRELFSDTAIELGIALESLLSQRDDPQDSLTYRLALRAALLQGGTLAQRRETASFVSRLYGIRSAAAHGSADIDGHWRGQDKVSVSGTSYTSSELEAVLTEGRHLVARLAVRLMEAGDFPSYKDLALSGGMDALEALTP